MKKTHVTASRKTKTFDKRYLIGVVVLLLVVAVLVVKFALDNRPQGQTTVMIEGDPFPDTAEQQVAWVERNQKPAMILYHSTNCVPCIAMDKLMTKVRVDFEPGITFVHVITNDNANYDVVGRSGIRFIPTSFFVSASGDREVVVGIIDEQVLRDKLKQLQAGN